jgi:hypothetical protein
LSPSSSSFYNCAVHIVADADRIKYEKYEADGVFERCKGEAQQAQREVRETENLISSLRDAQVMFYI